MADQILVTGAAGKTGQAIIRSLARKGQYVRALVRRQEQEAVVTSLGAHQVVIGDMRSPKALEEATVDVAKMYHIPPNVCRDELAIGRNLITAALKARVEQFVYHSVLHPQTQTMPHHWQKLLVEEKILESGLPFTILQPAAYMQNLLAQIGQGGRETTYQVPYSVHTRFSLVDLEDVAAVAAKVLTEEGHVGATYELAGPQALTQAEVAGILGDNLERELEIEQVPVKVWAHAARARGLGDYQLDALVKMFRYYDRHGLWGSARVLEWLLERKPTTLAEFLSRELARLDN
jgi:uncharacterized protein YbjT (DUF2867 family)